MAAPRYREKLKRLRIRNAMSQAELADKMRLTQATISNWERGKGVPSNQQKKDLKKILGVGATAEAPDLSDAPQVGPSSIGAWLTKSRLEKRMSVPEVAEAAGLSAAAVYNIESGRISNPRSETVAKLEKALDTSLPGETKDEIQREATIEGFGELVDFDPHNASDLPEAKGIYVLYDVSERPIYVGQASNIKNRIVSHREKFWFRAPIVQTAAYVEVHNQKLRTQVEKLLIRFLKSNAVINKQNVDR